MKYLAITICLIVVLMNTSMVSAQDSTFTIQLLSSPIAYWNVTKGSSQLNANIIYLSLGEPNNSGLSWDKSTGVGGNINYKRALLDNYGFNANATFTKIKIPFAQKEERAHLVDVGGNVAINIIDYRKICNDKSITKIGLTLSLGSYYSLLGFTILDYLYVPGSDRPLSFNCEISEICFPISLVAYVPLTPIISVEPFLRYNHKIAETLISVPEYGYIALLNEFRYETKSYDSNNNYGLFDYGININIMVSQKMFLHFGASISKPHGLQSYNYLLNSGIKIDWGNKAN